MEKSIIQGTPLDLADYWDLENGMKRDKERETVKWRKCYALPRISRSSFTNGDVCNSSSTILKILKMPIFCLSLYARSYSSIIKKIG